MTPLAYRFVWYELLTEDAAPATRFYQDVIGWTARDAGLPAIDYTILSAARAPVAGLMRLPATARAEGARSAWTGYVGVDDVDAFAARVAAAGGAVHRPPEDIPATGRFAIVADPQGATFGLFAGATGQAAPPPTPHAPGHAGWHQLRAPDQTAAFAFYAGLFGWTQAEAFDMGPMGIYQIFAAGGSAIGGMMTGQPSPAEPAWLFFFTVDAIEAAGARLTAAGGRVLNGPHQVPGGQWIIHAADPQGAAFALVTPPA